MSDDTKIADYLANHPRKIGVLFMLFLMLSQAGNAAAAWAVTTGGP